MDKRNQIGLNNNKIQELSEKLNKLLATYSVFYQNTRGFHWNIKGEFFFELHEKFEELYNDLLIKIDEIAERMLTLGAIPEHNYSKYLKMSEVKESAYITDGIQASENILSSLKTIITLQRELLSISDDVNDEGTNALMSDYISTQEKLVWMYAAFLNK